MDKVIACGCFLLVAVGYLLGTAWGLSPNSVSRLKLGLELASFAATISACGVAIYSLNMWRQQFKHAKEFEVLGSVHRAVNELKCCRSYAMAFMHLQFAARKRLPQQEYYQTRFEGLSAEWEEAKKNVSNSLGELAVICDEKVSKNLEVQLDQLSITIEMVTLKVTDELYEEAEPDVSRLARAANSEIHEAEQVLRSMQRILVSLRKQNISGNRGPIK